MPLVRPITVAPAWRVTIDLTIKLVDALPQLLKRARHPLNARPRLKQRLHDRLTPGLIDILGPLAVHERNIPCTMKDSCSRPRHPLNAYEYLAVPGDYTMACVRTGDSVTCRGGNQAVVTFPV